MHHSSLRKYLLTAAIALTVLAVDAFIGHSHSGSGQKNSKCPPEQLAKVASEAKPSPRIAALSSQSAAESFPALAGQAAPTDSTTEAELREKLTQQLQTIENDYKAIAQPVYDQSAPLISPEDRTKLAYLDQEKFEDLGKVLTTAELEVYQNKADETAAPKRR